MTARGASGRAGKPPGAILPSSVRSAQYAPSGYAARRVVVVVVAVFIGSRPLIVVVVVVGGARSYIYVFFVVRRRPVPARVVVLPRRGGESVVPSSSSDVSDFPRRAWVEFAGRCTLARIRKNRRSSAPPGDFFFRDDRLRSPV